MNKWNEIVVFNTKIAYCFVLYLISKLVGGVPGHPVKFKIIQLNTFFKVLLRILKKWCVILCSFKFYVHYLKKILFPVSRIATQTYQFLHYKHTTLWYIAVAEKTKLENFFLDINIWNSCTHFPKQNLNYVNNLNDAYHEIYFFNLSTAQG